MTLQMRPCGACRALVDAIEGCEHWTGGAVVTTPAQQTEAERVAGAFRQPARGKDPSRTLPRLMVLKRSPTQRKILQACVDSADGTMHNGGDRSLMYAAYKLRNEGMIEIVDVANRRRYSITELGRTVLAEYERVTASGAIGST